MSAQLQPILHGEEHLWFERLIADLSKRFINLDAAQVDSEIEAAQKFVCETLGLDRSTLAQWDENAKEFVVTHSWALPGFEPVRKLAPRDLPWCVSTIARGEVVRFARVSDLPEEAAKDKETLGRLGQKSGIMFPLTVGNRPIGVLAFGTLRAEREWSEVLVGRLRLIADLFAYALASKNSAAALLESQERTRLAVESAELGLWTWNLQEDEIWASERAYSLFGRAHGTELTYERFLNAVHPDDRDRVRNSFGAAALLPMEFQVDCRVILSDSAVNWISIRGRSYGDVNGKTVHMSGVVLDITERKAADERFRLVVESSPTAMVVADAGGNIVLANAQVEKIFGYQREELTGQPVELLVPERFRGAHASHRAGFAANPSARPMGAGRDLYGLRKDGSEFRIEIGLSPIQTNKGVQVLSAITDITDRIRAMEAVRDREELFRTVANSAPVLIWLSGPDKLCTFFNDGWLRFTGRTMEEEVGEGWASGVHPEDLNRCLEVYSTAFDARQDFEMEYRLRRFDGEFRWVVDRGIPSYESDGTFRGYVGSCIDITERKQSEQALKDANELLLEANQRIVKLKEQLEHENLYLQKEIIVERNHHEVVGQSDPIRRVLMKAEQVAPTNSAVLLLGETGTGKELIARAIQRNSKRAGRLMVKVNCAALPASLVENELFGREKGAYTGALTREVGRFELAHESTIFLDEIGELPLELQAKLLRVLQEGDFERLGSSRTIHVDVRVIAATSRDLEAAVREGKFREDLFYRLNVFPIRIPPLRDRPEDIPMLTWHFLRDLGRRMGREIESVRATTMNAFLRYSWPGNVRELRNVVERHLITNLGPVFEAELPEQIRTTDSDAGTAEESERRHILHVLERTGWRIRGANGAAEVLALKPTTLESRMKKLGIVRK
jgi:PAS domain S-box-containing protein